MNLSRCQLPTVGEGLPSLPCGRKNSVAGSPDFPKISLHMVEGPSSATLEWSSETTDGMKYFAPLAPAAALAVGGLAQPLRAENGREVPAAVDLWGSDVACIVTKAADINYVGKCDIKIILNAVRRDHGFGERIADRT